MALFNALFEANTLNELLQIFNDVYTKKAVEALSDLFSGTNPSLREVCDAAVEYCNASGSLLDDNVYLFTAPNGKKYVGQTTTLNKRMSSYRNNKGSNQHWTSALKLYTFEKFVIEHYSIPTACTDIIEKFMILWYDLTDRNNGYNKTSGGKFGYVFSNETREKLRVSHLGIPLSDEAKTKLKAWWTPKRKKERCGQNNPMFGRKNPNVVKSNRKRSGRNHPMFGKFGDQHQKFGKKASVDTCAKMSEVKKGKNNPMAKPVVVNGTLYSNAREATQKEFPNKNKSYVTTFIRYNPESTVIFKVSKDFYTWCNDSNLEHITRKMLDGHALQ